MRTIACAATRGTFIGALTSGLSGLAGSARVSSSEIDGSRGSSVQAIQTAWR
jgi:hypothetical protein